MYFMYVLYNNRVPTIQFIIVNNDDNNKMKEEKEEELFITKLVRLYLKRFKKNKNSF